MSGAHVKGRQGFDMPAAAYPCAVCHVTPEAAVSLGPPVVDRVKFLCHSCAEDLIDYCRSMSASANLAIDPKWGLLTAELVSRWLRMVTV